MKNTILAQGHINSRFVIQTREQVIDLMTSRLTALVWDQMSGPVREQISFQVRDVVETMLRNQTHSTYQDGATYQPPRKLKP